MKLTRLLALFCATFLFFSCGSNKYSVDKLPTKFIELGNGGGYTGEYQYYKIATNGQVFTTSSNDTAYAYFGKISKKIAKNAYNSLADLGDKKISEPGNLNYFIFRAEGDQVNSWLWSDDKKPATELSALYESLNKEIEKINKK